MGQPVTVIEKPSSRAGIVRFETNRVLTGMGHDGRAGVEAVKRAGGLTLAESAETAVIYGMPHAAAESGAVDEVLGLGGLAARLVRFARPG